MRSGPSCGRVCVNLRLEGWELGGEGFLGDGLPLCNWRHGWFPKEALTESICSSRNCTEPVFPKLEVEVT